MVPFGDFFGVAFFIDACCFPMVSVAGDAKHSIAI